MKNKYNNVIAEGKIYTQQQISAVLSFGEQHPAFRLFWEADFVANPRKYPNVKVKVYYNPNTTDCYTVNIKAIDEWDVYNMSEKPLSPQGVNLFEGVHFEVLEHGKLINWHMLPLEVRRAIAQRI